MNSLFCMKKGRYCAAFEVRVVFVYFFASTGQVLMPNSAYSGQKLTNEVPAKITAAKSNTSPSVPLMVPVKYKTANKAANTIRMIRSVFPTFFFMTLWV